MVHLALEINGNTTMLPIEGPGGTARVAVGEPGNRSSVWRVWASRQKADVYVAARVLAGVQKISLHESGDWRLQWVSGTKAEPFTAQTGTRLISQWDRPAEVGSGWTRGLTICVPHEDITNVPDDGQGREGVVWIPTPGPGRAIAITVVVAKPNQGGVRLDGAVPVDGFTLSNGEIVLILASAIGLDAGHRDWLDRHRSRIQEIVQDGKVDLSGAGAPRTTLFGHDDDGNRTLWDLAMPTLPPHDL